MKIKTATILGATGLIGGHLQVSTFLSFLFPSRYKPIRAHDVARSMVMASKINTPGTRIYQYNEMISLLS